MLSENFFQQLTTLNGGGMRFVLVNRTHLRNIVLSTLVPINYSMIVVQDEVVRGDEPVAVKSKLGYLPSGPVRYNPTSNSTTNVLNVIISPEIDKFDVERFWTIESLGIKAPEPNGKTADPSREY